MLRAFYPSAQHSDLQNAAICAEVALAAYTGTDHPSIRHWPYRREFEAGTDHGVVVMQGREVVIGIAGTDDLEDMRVNFDCRVGTIRGLQVHAGYLGACWQIAGALVGLDLPPIGDRRFRWSVVGHSAGGAKACILPLVLPSMRPDRIVTFGSPRCFRTGSAAVYPHPITRIDHPYDLVPDLPLHGVLGVFKRLAGWSHVGRAVYVWDDGRIDTENGYWIKRVVRHVCHARSIRPSRVLHEAFSDHDMEHIYARAMRPWTASQQPPQAA